MFVLSDPRVGFWLALCLLCLSIGFWLTDRKDFRKHLATPTFFLSIAMIVFFGVGTRGEDSSETALLAAFLHVLVPVTCMAAGTLIATFSGPSPVGPLPRGLRPLGFLMAYSGLLWIAWMLISQPPSAIANGIGQTIWGTWVVTFLSILILISALAGAFCVMMGEERHKEALTLAALTIAGAVMFYEIMQDGSEGMNASGWHAIHWQELMFLVGGLIGLLVALLAFIALVYIAEKRAPDPDVVPPLTEEEKGIVEAVLRSNLNIVEGEE
ncbi:MAG: hypothetical protein CMB65_01375 [Euryarchaeota archaeon]|nr:hypothetical protein [Euryarchaeota archaeon]